MMMTRTLPLVLTLTAVCLTAGCKDSSIGRALEPEAATQRLRQEVKRLRAAGFLEDSNGDELPGDPRAFFERLDGLDAFLANSPDWDDSSPSHPDWWNSESKATLAERIAPLDPFFDDLSSLLHLPDAEQALAAGRHLARRTRPGKKALAHEEDYDPFATPSGPRLSRWVDLLCARAVARSTSAIHSDGSVASLADALDLLWLLEDDSMRGVRIVAGLEGEVLRALQIIAPGTVVDPDLMESSMDPRLARLGQRARVFAALRREVSRRVEIAETVLSEPARADQDHWLTELGSSRTLLPEHALKAIDIQDQLRGASSLCVLVSRYGPSGSNGGTHTFQELLDGVGELHDLENHIYLARVALAANAWRFEQGEWPRFISELAYGDQPAPSLECRSRRLEYTREFAEVRLALVGRRESGPDSDPLATWTWNSDVLKQFRENGN